MPVEGINVTPNLHSTAQRAGQSKLLSKSKPRACNVLVLVCSAEFGNCIFLLYNNELKRLVPHL